jgi:anti-sigma factor RsiW
MIAHLSSEQLSECILGQPSPIVAQHVQDCPTCRAELANLREALGEFRGAVRAWSEDRANAALAIPAAFPEPRSWTAAHQLAGVLLVAAAFILASIFFPRHGGEQPPALAGSDVVLLDQVDAQVSREVPSSMEPLMKLVVQTNTNAEKQE